MFEKITKMVKNLFLFKNKKKLFSYVMVLSYQNVFYQFIMLKKDGSQKFLS